MERKYKIRLQRKSGVWFACTDWDARYFDIETSIIAMGDTPEQAYNEWQRLAGRRDDRARTQEKWFNVFNLLFYVSSIIGMLLFGAFWLAAYLK